jgi:hypothetical protein
VALLQNLVVILDLVLLFQIHNVGTGLPDFETGPTNIVTG